MWVIELITFSYFFYFFYFLNEIQFIIFNFFDPFIYNGLTIFNWKFYYQFAQNMSFFFGLKFLLCVGFLILIRGGAPRYRYDYLTKLGWLKFLGLIILVFFFSLILFFIF
jgi:NADH:ubiquinone oxidoreductase subunit H